MHTDPDHRSHPPCCFTACGYACSATVASYHYVGGSTIIIYHAVLLHACSATVAS